MLSRTTAARSSASAAVRRARASSMCATDTGLQLAGAERLDQVIIRSRLDPVDAGFFAGASREHDDRNRRCQRVCPQFAQQAEAIQSRHHHVGEHQIGPLGSCCRQALRGRLRPCGPRTGQRAGVGRNRACRHCRQRPGPVVARRSLSSRLARGDGSRAAIRAESSLAPSGSQRDASTR